MATDTTFICPKCGSTDQARNVYGRPVLDESTLPLFNAGRLRTAGNGDPAADMREWHCNACDHDWSTPEYAETLHRVVVNQRISAFGWTAAVFIAFAALLYVAMDYHWTRFGSWCTDLATVIALAMGLTLSVVAVRAKRRLHWRWGTVFVLVSLLALYRSAAVLSRGNTGSCANHMHHICMPFSDWSQSAKSSPEARLPDSIEFQDFLDFLATHGFPHAQHQYCSGRRRSPLKTGYAFIGGDLTLKTIKEKQPLLAFCDAACHPMPYDRDQHALAGTEDTPKCVTTDALVELIKTAMRQAESGEVPYSAKAVEVMKEQLRRRGR